MRESIWLSETASPGYSTDTRDAEVVVIGAGLTGLLTAWQLCQEGRKVLVLEARQVGTGTSGYTTGKITSQHRIVYQKLLKALGQEYARAYAEANQWAVQAYVELVRQEEIECDLQETSAYVYSEGDIEPLQKENEAAVKLGLPTSLESVPISANRALCFRHQAQFHPSKFMLALAERIINRGGAIAENTRVLEVEEKNDHCTVTTAHGKVDAEYVVFATLFPILDHSIYAARLKPVQHHGIAYSYAKREFDGMFVGVDDISFRYHNDSLIVVGGDVPLGHGDGDGAYRDLEQKARERFSVKDEKTRWSAHDLHPPDSVPFIGPYHPGSRRRFAATGFKGWGITHAMIASKLLSDMIACRDNAWADLYSPSRMHGAVEAMAKQATSAMAHLLKGGKHCSHMGCTLHFNKQDQTYDCPCHGSRFDEDGNVLWGPAVKNLD